jgi:catechol 2,3-dioxygenase-like lactoylglutathione lyase family enzyme
MFHVKQILNDCVSDTDMKSRPLLVPELICSDLDKSLDFYVGLLGFVVLYARPEDRFAYLDRGGAELMLEEFAPGARMLANAPFERPYGRGINFQIRIEDAETLYAAVIGAGPPPFLPLEERWYRRDDIEIGTRQFIVEDPDGYLIRLQQDIGNRPHTARAPRSGPGL